MKSKNYYKFIKLLNKIIAFLGIIFSINHLYYFFNSTLYPMKKAYEKGILTYIDTYFVGDMIFSAWIFLLILIYASVLILINHKYSNLIYQFVLIGFLADFLFNTVLLNIFIPFSYVTIYLLSIILLIYFNLNIVKKNTNWIIPNFKFYGKSICIIYFIMSLSIFYYYEKYGYIEIIYVNSYETDYPALVRCFHCTLLNIKILGKL